MKYIIYIFTLVSIFTSCIVNRSKVELSKLKINGKYRNDLIIDRVPQYGNGRKDGCIINKQISLLIELSNASNISGKVIDSKTNESIAYANLNIYEKDENVSINMMADSIGCFTTNNIAKPIKIVVKYIGYKTLTVELSDMQFNKLKNNN